MIALDFFSGSHGHFLEYVINTWLFKGPRVNNIFTDLGASHNIRRDIQYSQERIICADHYSEFNKELVNPSKIVRITIAEDWANWIYQINVLARAGDIPLEKKIKLTDESVRASPVAFRREWYSKFNLLEHGYQRPGNWLWPDANTFEFAMENLFDLENFYNELYRVADFLETTFVPDRELSNLLLKFLEKNQGWQYYVKCKNLYQHALTGNNVEFSSDAISQALLNSMISKSIGVFDGSLFDNDLYPTATDQVWKAIEDHLTLFDQKF